MARPKTRTIVLQVEVTVPITTGEAEVRDAINSALDEDPDKTPFFWGNWKVGDVKVVDARKP